MSGATGWFPDDILDRLTWQDVLDFQEHWKNHPPVQWMVQGYLGFNKKEDESAKDESSPDGLMDVVESLQPR